MKDNPSNRTIERTIRIERLRLQAALDRNSVSQSAYRLANACRPSTIMGNWLSNTPFAQPSNVLSRGATLLNKYPYVSASLSSLLLGRKSRVLRFAGVMLGSVGVWRPVLRAVTRDNSNR